MNKNLGRRIHPIAEADGLSPKKLVKEERLDDNKLGTICVAEGVLRIADNFNNLQQCESSKISTFIHQIVHGILDTMGESELSGNEKFVCTFSSLLIDTIEEIVKVNKKVQD